jgi:hypothetical protein
MRLTFVATALVTHAMILGTVASSPALAQGSDVRQQFQQSIAANRQRLATYSWEEQQIVSLKGEVKSQNRYLVRVGPDGQTQKTPINAVQKSGGGGLMGKIAGKKVDELKDYAQQIVGLVQTYLPPDPEKVKQAFQNSTGSIGHAGPDEVQAKFIGYNQKGDSMTLVFNKARKSIQSAQVSSYLNGDESDAVKFSARFDRLPDGTNHLASATVNGEKKHLTIQIVNSNYQKM